MGSAFVVCALACVATTSLLNNGERHPHRKPREGARMVRPQAEVIRLLAMTTARCPFFNDLLDVLHPDPVQVLPQPFHRSPDPLLVNPVSGLLQYLTDIRYLVETDAPA